MTGKKSWVFSTLFNPQRSFCPKGRDSLIRWPNYPLQALLWVFPIYPCLGEILSDPVQPPKPLITHRS